MRAEDHFPPVFIISLKTEPERRARAAARMAEQGIAFEFFDAVDGRQFDVRAHPAYAGLRRRLFFGKDLTGGELGCILSHRAVMEKITVERIPLALVFEDDVILEPGFSAVVRRLIDCDYPWQMVRFLGTRKVAAAPHRKRCDLDGVYDLRRVFAPFGGAHAYLIKQDAAKILARKMRRNWTPNDTLMGHPWRTGLENLIVQPGIARQDLSFESAIGEKRFENRQLSGWEAFAYPLTRACYKAYEGILKRVWYIPG